MQFPARRLLLNYAVYVSVTYFIESYNTTLSGMSSIILTKTYPNVNFFITTVEVDTPVKNYFYHRMVFLRKKSS
jgi:hypothetical protein